MRIFVSYNSKDRQWAEWIAYRLEELGHTAIIQAWDFRPGQNFVQQMQDATQNSDKTIAVLSQNYLDAQFTQPEWTAAFARDPTGQARRLIPVRVAECDLQGLLSPHIYVDLVGLSEDQARTALQQALEPRAKPATSPPFPGNASTSSTSLQNPPPSQSPPPSIPNPAALAQWREQLEYLQVQEAIVADPAQKFALKKQIETAKGKIREYGGTA